jgi:cellulose synthase/poly-beta-1,6-N-acetylglucosamine synthase-like glycosyltransferase
MWRTLLTGYQYVLLVYFSSLNILYALFSCVGLRAIVVVFAREFSQGSLRDLLERDVYQPVSILVPAHNEEVSIVGSVQSLLNLQFPEFEIVVVSDGSEDETMQRLIEAFALAELPWATRQDLPSAHVRRTMRSLTHPNLIVVDKEQGGKADSLNAALNMARYPLFAAVDADSLLDGEAILRATRLFVEDETLIGVGGTIRPLNAAVVENRRVLEAKIPKKWLERFQILEYAWAFFTGRAGWSHFKSLLIISGAFGLFRRTAVLEAGGFKVGTVAEDMELVVRLHKHFRQQRKPYNIRFTPTRSAGARSPRTSAPCAASATAGTGGCGRRSGPTRRCCSTRATAAWAWSRCRTSGSSRPWPRVIEISGYVLVVVGMFAGFVSPRFAILFVVLAVLYGMLSSQLGSGIETFLSNRYPRLRDRAVLFLAAFLEFVGYRQFLALERTVATVQVPFKRGQWGKMHRKGIRHNTQAPPPADLEEERAPAGV